jgi:hypothetical protein
MCRCGLNPLKDVQGQESISLCHGQFGKFEKIALKETNTETSRIFHFVSLTSISASQTSDSLVSALHCVQS